MSIKTTTTILCLSLALAACGDSGEVTDPAPVDLGTDFLGDGESTTADGAGIAGQMPVDVGSDDSGDIGDAGALPSDVATDDEGLAIDDGTDSTDTTDTDTDAVDTVDSDTTEADDTVPVVPATGGRVILPGDCEIVATDANLQFCLSPSAGNRVFALDADDNLRWTTTLSEQNDRDSALLVPGNDLFVLRPQNDNNVVLTALDSVGDVEYEAVLTGDMNVLVEGFFEAPNLFLHSKNSIGDSSVLQIDGSTGRQNLVRSFPGETIESIGIEDLDGTRFLTVISGGVTSYLTMDTLEPFTRIFTLDPTNFQQAFPAQMATLRGSYMADFFSVLNQSINLVDVTSTETEVACPAAGSITLLPENSFLGENQFTRAFEFVDCDFNGVVANGSLTHTLFELETSTGSNGTESLQFNEMMLTRATDMVDDNGVPFDEDKVLSAMLSNVFVFSGDNFTSERSLETENYTQSFDGVPVLEIAGATYTRLIDTAHPDVQGGGFRLEELGALRSQSDTSGTVGVNIEQPVVFLQSDALNTSVPVDDAPLSGFIALSASDTSTLEVDATRGGVNLQNYTLTQRGTEFTIDDMWTVDPVSTSLRLLE